MFIVLFFVLKMNSVNNIILLENMQFHFSRSIKKKRAKQVKSSRLFFFVNVALTVDEIIILYFENYHNCFITLFF